VPPVSHPEVATYALEHGANVLCEKPFTIDTTNATRLVEVAKRNNRYLTMASKFRFVEDVAKARQMVRNGVIGKMVLCEIAFCARAEMGGRWPSNVAISGGGVLIDNGSHAVDIIRYLLGPISRVQAQHGRNIQGLDVEDTTMVFVETVDGVWGRIDLSWSIEKNHDAFICMHGSEGMIVIGWSSSRYRRYDTKEWTQFGDGYNKLKAFVQQHRNFIDCVHDKAQPVINAEDSLESVRVIEVAYRSARDNKWLEVEECLAR
jgi:predicted dehydrogenase